MRLTPEQYAAAQAREMARNSPELPVAALSGSEAPQVQAKPARAGRSRKDYFGLFLTELALLALPEPQLEFVFHPERKWRFDAAWNCPVLQLPDDGVCRCGHYSYQHHNAPSTFCMMRACSCNQFSPGSVNATINLKIALEYNGIFGERNASHASRQGLMRDYRKISEAQLLGWIVLQLDAKSIESGEAHDWVRRAFELRGWKKS